MKASTMIQCLSLTTCNIYKKEEGKHPFSFLYILLIIRRIIKHFYNNLFSYRDCLFFLNLLLYL